MKKVLIASALLSVFVFLLLRGTPPQADVLQTDRFSHSEQMENIQNKLKLDPNQAELWFQLGNGYLDKQEFQFALTCFDYAIRLNQTPIANHFAAKATALYFLKKQHITTEIQQLLDAALALDSDNATVLTLVASDHFMNLRYAKAIDVWTKLLESEHSSELNRVSIIHQLNQAKQMLQTDAPVITHRL